VGTNGVLLAGAAGVIALVAIFICFSAAFLLNAWQLGPKVLHDLVTVARMPLHVSAR